MTGSRAFFPIFGLVLLLLLSHNTPGNAGCRSGSAPCSGRSALRRDLLRKTINQLFLPSSLLTRLTYRALNYTKFEYNVTDYCNPSCTSLALTIKADMNLTSSSWTNVSRGNILEFYRRVVIGYGQQLTESIAQLSRSQKVATAPAYLTTLERFMLNDMKRVVTKAVKLDRNLKGLPALNTTAAVTPRVNTSPWSQSIDAVACHIWECVLNDLYTRSIEMLIDFNKLKSSV